jgi:hypothetical protein
MNTENKIAEQAAEIANLNLVLAERKAKIAELMGEAARAEIAGAAASVPQAETPALSAVQHAIHNLKEHRAGRSLYFPGEAIGILERFVAASVPQLAVPQDERLAALLHDRRKAIVAMDEAAQKAIESKIIAHVVVRACSPDVAPLPEPTGPSAGSVKDDHKFLRLLTSWDLAVPGKEAGDIFDRIAAHLDSRLAASPSPAPAQQPNTEALEMLARVLKYIDPHAVDVALARTGPMEDAYINTIARKCVERCMAKVETAAPGASIGDDPEFDELIYKLTDAETDRAFASSRYALVAFLDQRGAQ